MKMMNKIKHLVITFIKVNYSKLKDRLYLIEKWFSDSQHDWYSGHFSLGERSQYTGDLIGRNERHCLHCDKKQMRLTSLSLEHQKQAHLWFSGDKASFEVWIKEYHNFEDGDMMDRVTKKILTSNAEKDELNEQLRIIGDGSQLLKF